MNYTPDPFVLDWDSLEAPREEAPVDTQKKTHSPQDALLLSLNNKNRVDPVYMGRLCGMSPEEVLAQLKGLVFQNPKTWLQKPLKGWETREEYLSGHIKDKWTAAKKAHKEHGGFEENIKALESVMPPQIQSDDMYITLGSPWIPPEYIDQFIHDTFSVPLNVDFSYRWKRIKTVRNPYGWYIPDKARYKDSVLVKKTYGTSRIGALHLLQLSLNMQVPNIYDEVHSTINRSGKAKVLNEEETLLAIEKQDLLVETFKHWVRRDPRRLEELQKLYMDKYGYVRQRRYDGSYLSFPGMASEEELYSYQKDAVCRILSSPNTLLAHDVGSGKTYIMAAAAMKMRSLKISSKNLFVVPNNIVGQWRDIFLSLFPKARLLVVDPAAFKPARRRQVLEQIRDEDYDGIIMAYSCFDMIPLSREYYRQTLEEEEKELKDQARKEDRLLGNYRRDESEATPVTKERLKRVRRELRDLDKTDPDGRNLLPFDELGITRLFVDEAHNYKNLPMEGKGFFSAQYGKGSAKAKSMLDKVRHIQRTQKGGGVIMATGTPITNSVSDIFVLQQYLQGGQLALMDLSTIDSWVGMFAERTTAFEIDVDTNNYKFKTRLSSFHNIPELTDMIISFTDFHRLDKEDGIPECDFRETLLDQSPELESFLEDISRRADDVRKRRVRTKDDNLLKITTDGRKAALDMRLVKPETPLRSQAKVCACADQVARIYRESDSFRGTQLVFCDISVPKAGFNLYDALREELIQRGIPGEEIAFIHSAENDAARNRLYSRMRSGRIRVLLGSTMKLGLGVNVQERLIALHHLDVPWRPADMTQREGRILRQGNQNPRVQIFRYVTAGSFDAYSWQLLERKQRFITDLLAGVSTNRFAENDVEDTVLSYAEIKALAIGNPRLRERCEVANELYRYQLLQKQALETHQVIRQSLDQVQERVKASRDYLTKLREDAKRYRSWRDSHAGYGSSPAERAEREEVRRAIQSTLRRIKRPQQGVKIASFKGFDLYASGEEDYIRERFYLAGSWRYPIIIPQDSQDPLAHLDAFLGQCDQRVQYQTRQLMNVMAEKKQLENEMNTRNYYAQIQELEDKLAAIDKELGVKE